MDTLVKTTVKELARVVQKTGAMGYSQGLDFVSKKFGFADWNAFSPRLGEVTITAEAPDDALNEYAIACGCRNWLELKDAISEFIHDDATGRPAAPEPVLKVGAVPYNLPELATGMLFLGDTNGVTAAMIGALRDALEVAKAQDLHPGGVLFDFNQTLARIAAEVSRNRGSEYEMVVLGTNGGLPLFETDDPQVIAERLRLAAGVVAPSEPWDPFMERIVLRIIAQLRMPANRLLFELRRVFCSTDELLVHFTSRLLAGVADGPGRRDIVDDLRIVIENPPIRERLRKSFERMLSGIDQAEWVERFGSDSTRSLTAAFKRGTVFIVPLHGINANGAAVTAAVLLKLSFQAIANGLVPNYGATARRVILASSCYDKIAHFERPDDSDFFAIAREASVIPIMQLLDPSELRQRCKRDDQFTNLLGGFGSVISQTRDDSSGSPSDAQAEIETIMKRRRSASIADEGETFQSLARPLPVGAIEVLKVTW